METATTTKYTAQPWSCKDFDEEACQQQIANNLQEQYNTIFDCCFLPAAAAQGQEGLLLAAMHSGDVRLFDWRQVCTKWLATRGQQQQHKLSWRAHQGPVNALALLQFNGTHLLATAGADGLVKLWRLADILAAAAAAAEVESAAAAAAHQTWAAMAEVQLPHLHNPLGFSDGRQPAAQALATDQEHQQLFIGGSDGGVHAWRLPQLAAAAAALGSLRHSATAAAALSLVAMPGHAAAVLGLDYCSATNQLASASEDGTVRVWDGLTHSCLSIIHPNPCPTRDDPGPQIPLHQPAQLLKCARSPGNVCVRFDEGGNWLLIANADGFLVLWSCRLNAAAAHTRCTKAAAGSDGAGAVEAADAAAAAAVVPQALLVTPSTVYVAGTDRQLHQYSFQLALLHSFEVTAESAFGVAHDPGSGMLAVCGSRGCLDLLSAEGNSLGHIAPPASVFVPAP